MFNIYNQSVYVETAFNRYFLGHLVDAGQHEDTYLRLRLFLSANNPYFVSFKCNRLERTNNKNIYRLTSAVNRDKKHFLCCYLKEKKSNEKVVRRFSGNSHDVRFCEFKGFSILYYFFSPERLLQSVLLCRTYIRNISWNTVGMARILPA